MFLLSAQNNVCTILRLFVEGYVKSKSSLNFMYLVGFQASKIVELVWKSFSGRNNSLEPLVFCFCSSRLYGLEESIKSVESFDWMVFGVIDIQKCKESCLDFFFAFLSRHYGFMNCFEILNFVISNIIPGRVSICKILTLL